MYWPPTSLWNLPPWVIASILSSNNFNRKNFSISTLITKPANRFSKPLKRKKNWFLVIQASKQTCFCPNKLICFISYAWEPIRYFLWNLRSSHNCRGNNCQQKIYLSKMTKMTRLRLDEKLIIQFYVKSIRNLQLKKSMRMLTKKTNQLFSALMRSLMPTSNLGFYNSKFSNSSSWYSRKIVNLSSLA